MKYIYKINLKIKGTNISCFNKKDKNQEFNKKQVRLMEGDV